MKTQTGLGFNNPAEFEEFKEMIAEFEPYKCIKILSAQKVGGDTNPWMKVALDLSELQGPYKETIYNDTSGNWDVFWA